MLYIICAEMSEAKNIKVQHPDLVVQVTGAGLCNILKRPRLSATPNDLILNIGYAGSNLFKPGEIFSVCTCQRLNPSKTIKEEKQYLFPYYFLGADCYTADDFVEKATQELPLVDMELYYLSLIYPNIRAIKIVSDNLNYSDFKKCDFKDSWERVNKAIEDLLNAKN